MALALRLLESNGELSLLATLELTSVFISSSISSAHCCIKNHIKRMTTSALTMTTLEQQTALANKYTQKQKLMCLLGY